MKSFATITALVSVIPGMLALMINTPTGVVPCQPELLSWQDGIAPYFLSIIPGGQPSAAPLKSFPTQSGNSVTWIVDIAGGTPVTFALKDSTGATAYTDTVNIQNSNDPSCSVAPTGGSAPAIDSSNSGAASAPGVATQAAVASTSAVAGAAAISPARSSVGTVATSAAAIPATQSRAAVATVSGAGSATASRATTTNTSSGAESRFTTSGLGFTGVFALIGAMLL